MLVSPVVRFGVGEMMWCWYRTEWFVELHLLETTYRGEASAGWAISYGRSPHAKASVTASITAVCNCFVIVT